MDHYTIALNLNPRNLPAQEGLQKLEQSTDTGLSGAGGGGGGGAGGGASSTAAGSVASERTYDIDMDGTSGDGGNALGFYRYGVHFRNTYTHYGFEGYLGFYQYSR